MRSIPRLAPMLVGMFSRVAPDAGLKPRAPTYKAQRFNPTAFGRNLRSASKFVCAEGCCGARASVFAERFQVRRGFASEPFLRQFAEHRRVFEAVA